MTQPESAAGRAPTGNPRCRVWAPGRVNLIGEHTDYSSGRVLPMAIQLGVTFDVEANPEPEIRLATDIDAAVSAIAVPCTQPATVEPPWSRYVAGVASVLNATNGMKGTISSTLPAGSGLSSSAAIEVASAVAIRALAGPAGPPSTSARGSNGGPTDDEDPVGLARLCQKAEQLATGVPCGIMDQLAVTAASAGAATLIDCRSLDVTTIEIPAGLEIAVVHSGEHRSLADGRYALRSAEVAAAGEAIGPLRDANLDDIASIEDSVLADRARHVVTENQRVLDMVEAIRGADLLSIGAILDEGHRSLSEDFAVSTPGIDQLCDKLRRVPGVAGARLTGAGFGGCVVVIGEAGWRLPEDIGHARWRVRSVGGPQVTQSI